MEEGRRRRFRRLAGAATAAVGLLAASQGLTPTPALADGIESGVAAASASPGCGPVSCQYTRTGQSLFRVPAGVTLLQVDVIGAGAPATSPDTAAAHHVVPRKGEAVEVEGNLALPPHMSTLEVVVGGKNTLGGTTSEIMTSSDSTSRVLVAADGVPVSAPKDTKAAKQAKATHPSSKQKERSTGVARLVSTPTRAPVGGSVAPASGPARVVISWRAPGKAAQVVSSPTPTLTAGTRSTFEVRAVAATVPALSEIGSLPLGLRFHDRGNGTAAIEGVPEVDGVYPLEVTAVAGADPPATQDMVLIVQGGMIRLGAATRGEGAEQPAGGTLG